MRDLDELDRALAALSTALDKQRATHLDLIYAAVRNMMDVEGGVSALAERASRFESCGVFRIGPWADPAKLLPRLVVGGLLADDKTAAMEVMSELRVLAIATGHLPAALSQDGARAFLREVIVLNLSLLTPSGTEAEQARSATYQRARVLLQYLLEHLSPTLVQDAFVSELDALCAQRPIVTQRARTMIERMVSLPDVTASAKHNERMQLYRLAVGQPSRLSQMHRNIADYQRALRSADAQALDQEARAFANTLRLTGLGNEYHAVLLRHVAEHDHTLIGPALGLNPMGEAMLLQQLDNVRSLIEIAIRPETRDAIYGLAGMLERGLLNRRVVIKGLLRLSTLTLHTSTTKALMTKLHSGSSVNANTLLVAGAINVLGQPLGVGQGHNPTCQSARALSLWSLHAPGYLLNLLTQAASDGALQMDFEGSILQSDLLTGGLARNLDPDLDPVSLILVPHLDRIYDAMAVRATGRGSDVHRWVNPALYGRWVPLGFACAIHEVTLVVARYDLFVRRFYATHHPSFNDGDDLSHPNPVGILVTDVHGRLLGPHAVSLLRIDEDPHGELRAYFFNPNNEGRQAWGPNTVVSVAGHGEAPGESSLPFARFAARLYAFHYHRLEGGDLDAVPDSVIAAVTEDSQQSWGRSYPWQR